MLVFKKLLVLIIIFISSQFRSCMAQNYLSDGNSFNVLCQNYASDSPYTYKRTMTIPRPLAQYLKDQEVSKFPDDNAIKQLIDEWIQMTPTNFQDTYAPKAIINFR